jgi:hypothetical protein
MIYRYGQRVKNDKRSLKKYIVGGVASILMVSGAGGIALAGTGGFADYCSASANGCAQSGADSGSCAGHGSFGAFGKGNNFGNDTSGHAPLPGNNQNGNGANGQLTGANNSGFSEVCTQ